MLVAGIDSSTQSTKVVLCDAADGTVVASGSAPHPPGTEVDPQAWWHALQLAGEGLLSRAGAVAVSVGTSGTAFAVTDGPAADPSGAVAGFADATGRFLSLVCTINAVLVLASVAAMTGTDLPGLAERALAAEPGASGVALLPYFDGERTPNLPLATGVISGLTTANATAENLARAAVDGVLCSLAEAAARLAAHGVEQRRVLLIGGGARSPAVCALAPGVFGVDVDVPAPGEYVALGAARQAAWALAGTPQPPDWPPPPARRYGGSRAPDLMARFAALRHATTSWAGGLPVPQATG
jgi:xylulokinase